MYARDMISTQLKQNLQYGNDESNNKTTNKIFKDDKI